MSEAEKPKIDREEWRVKVMDSGLNLSDATRAKLLDADDNVVGVILEIINKATRGTTGDWIQFLRLIVEVRPSLTVSDYAREFGFVNEYFNAVARANLNRKQSTRGQVAKTIEHRK
jgi:hypothetical protein